MAAAAVTTAVLVWLACCSLIALFAAPMVGAQACQSSGMCSKGKTKPYTGDIATSQALKSMLEAVSYKKEIIMTCVTAQHADPHLNGPWIDQILQLLQELEGLGFGHLLVLSPTALECQLIHAHMPHISCVWDSTPLALWGKPREGTKNRVVWFNRWKFFARAGRLGYNVMNLDGDFIWFRDPYPFIKSPPMSRVQLWCNPSSGEPMFCNGGFIYMQNAQPDGPVTWIFKQFVFNQMWLMDDEYRQFKSIPSCYSDDQEVLFDNIRTAYVGRPLLPTAVWHCREPEWTIKTRIGTSLTKEQVLENGRVVVGPPRAIYNITKVQPPADWFLGVVPEDDTWTNMIVNSLTVPNMAFGYPDELGGWIASKAALNGPHVRAWEELLKQDCPDCPWWKDSRALPQGKDELEFELGPFWNGTRGSHIVNRFWDEGLPTEMIGIGPAWLSNSMFGYRVGMWSGPAAKLPAPFAMGHVCYWRDLTRSHKPMVRKALGRYNFTLGAAILPDGPYQAKYTPTRVLALHPDIDLRRTRSMEEFNRIVIGLVQVGQLAHRTVLLPDVPCEAPWMHATKLQGTKACKVPFNQQERRLWLPSNLPYPADTDGNLLGGWLGQTWPPADRSNASITAGAEPSPADQEVIWRKYSKWMFALGYLWDEPCTRGLGKPAAITTPEFAYWKSQHMPDSAEQPGRNPPPLHAPNEQNTVLMPSSEVAGLLKALPTEDDRGQGWVMKPQDARGWSIADAQVLVPGGQVIHSLSQHAKEPLLYLRHPVAVITSTLRHERGDTHAHGTIHIPAQAHRRMALAADSEPVAAHRIGVDNGTQHRHVVSVAQVDKQVKNVNERIKSSGCRLTQVSVDQHMFDPVGSADLTFLQAPLGIIHNNKVQMIKEVAQGGAHRRY